MANDEMKQIWKVPEPTLRRLPWYLAFLKLMKGRGEAFVSSTQIAKEINVDPSQVAKDRFVTLSLYRNFHWHLSLQDTYCSFSR